MTNEARKSMDKALKEILVPRIRAEGFKGSYPHFRRDDGGKLDLLMIQFYSSGGSFVVEIAQCDAEGFATGWGACIEPGRVRVADVWPRLRLGSKPEEGINDHWFEFNRPNYEHQIAHNLTHYETIAQEVVELFLDQAEQWWALNKRVN